MAWVAVKRAVLSPSEGPERLLFVTKEQTAHVRLSCTLPLHVHTRRGSVRAHVTQAQGRTEGDFPDSVWMF